MQRSISQEAEKSREDFSIGERGFKQLTRRDRSLISILKEQKLSISEIARRIGRNKSTVSRELKRNQTRATPQEVYFLFRVQRLWTEEELDDFLRSLRRESESSRSCEDKKRGGKLHRLLKRFGERKERLGDRDSTARCPGGLEWRSARQSSKSARAWAARAEDEAQAAVGNLNGLVRYASHKYLLNYCLMKRQLQLIAKSRRPKHAGGRPPKNGTAGVPHLVREKLTRHEPVHVTLRVRHGIGYLRKQRMLATLEQAFREAKERFGMHVVHYSVQGNHVHLIVEAEHRGALAKGMQGLAIRLAKAINRVHRRHGAVWADRYHSRVVRSRREMANVLRYVLGNFSKHATGKVSAFVDVFTSVRFLGDVAEDAPVAAPRAWLLRIGWRAPR